MIQIGELIEEIKNLKPIPAIANRLLDVVDNPGFSMDEIVNVIKYDPVITSGVLKACNSAFFGLKNPAESIKDAVTMLGTDQIIEIVMMKSGARVLSGNQDGYGLEKGDMWRYSVSSALISKQLAIDLNLKNINTIFTSALVKDIGKIILEKHVLGAVQKIRDLVENQNFSFREAEKKIFGIDHAELGAMVAKEWKFSSRMIKIIRHHHLSDQAMVKDRDVAVVYLADCICMMMGVGVGSDGLSYRFKDQVIRDLGLSADDVALIIADFCINIKEIEELLDIV